MKDEDKTSEQRKDGLAQMLRQRIAELEALESRCEQTEKALRDAEEKYRVLFGAAPVAIGLADADGKVFAANWSMQELTGYTLEALKSIRIDDTYVDPDERQSLLKTLKQYRRVRDREVRLRRKDGTVYTALLNVDLLELGGRQVLFTTARDITRRKQAEQALRESEARNRALLAAMPDLIFRMSRDGIFLEYMPAREVDLYKRPSEFLGRSVREVLPEEVAKRCVEHIERALRTGETEVLEYELPIGGRPRSYEARMVACAQDEAIVIIRDITERKRAEEELKKFKLMVESASDAIFFKDLDSRYVIANDKTWQAFGLSGEEVLGKNDLQIMPDEEEARRNIEDDRVVFKTGKSKTITKHMTAKDGRERCFEAIKVPQFDEDGKVIGLVGIARDVTHRKRLEEAMRTGEHRFRSLVEAAGDIIWEVDQDSIYTYISPRVKDILGYEPEELIGKKTPYHLMPPDEAERVRRIVSP